MMDLKDLVLELKYSKDKFNLFASSSRRCVGVLVSWAILSTNFLQMAAISARTYVRYKKVECFATLLVCNIVT